MKKLIWAIMQISLGCCGIYTIVDHFITGNDILILGIMISVWIIPGVQTMREYLQDQRTGDTKLCFIPNLVVGILSIIPLVDTDPGELPD